MHDVHHVSRAHARTCAHVTLAFSQVQQVQKHCFPWSEQEKTEKAPGTPPGTRRLACFAECCSDQGFLWRRACTCGVPGAVPAPGTGPRNDPLRPPSTLDRASRAERERPLSGRARGDGAGRCSEGAAPPRRALRGHRRPQEGTGRALRPPRASQGILEAQRGAGGRTAAQEGTSGHERAAERSRAPRRTRKPPPVPRGGGSWPRCRTNAQQRVRITTAASRGRCPL